MADNDQKTVVVEKEDRRSSAPLVVAIAVVVLVLVALFGLPYLSGGGSSITNINVTPAPSGQ